MITAQILHCCSRTRLLAFVGLALCLQAPLVKAQSLSEVQVPQEVVTQNKSQRLQLGQRDKTTYDTYILGPGDGLQIELLDLPELSGLVSIGPGGTIYLPRLRSVYVNGLTIEELRTFLTKEFRTFVRDPQVYIYPVHYRPIRVYVGGEVKTPGYYTLTGGQFGVGEFKNSSTTKIGTDPFVSLMGSQNTSFINKGSKSTLFGSTPTVFDAIRSAQGITPYSDLSRVQVIRKRGESLGGGRVSTNLNFVTLINDGDESQNIRLFDGDVVRISKGNEVMGSQLLKATHSNINPRFINVFVSGRVEKPSGITLPNGSSLNQAIAMVGGVELIRGKVEFVRFAQNGEPTRKVFRYNPRAAVGAEDNPLLTSGDLIRVRDSLLSATTEVLDGITKPAVGLYTLFSLLEGFK